MTQTISTNSQGHLTIGGVDTLELVKEFGTPLIAYDVKQIKQQIAAFKEVFIKENVSYQVTYASKAFSALAMYQLIAANGVGCDVVSGGELYAALQGSMAPEMIEFHGNNKLPAELEMAVDAQIGCIVIDNFQEIEFLDEILTRKQQTIKVALRITPGVEAETHEYITTGQSDSKFGFDVLSGQAKKALEQLLANPRMQVCGIHCHIGSQIFAVDGFIMAAKEMVRILKQWHDELGFEAQILNLGGGFGIRYTKEDQPLPAQDFVKEIIRVVKQEITQANLNLPEIWIEPGRALVGQAATTLYTIGSSKEVADVCHFIAVDGGMGDNIRPALYQAKYDAFLAKDPLAKPTQVATIVGKYCESGDVLVKNCELPDTKPGDILAIPSTGAYGYTMASNYNRNPRPAVVFCEDGQAKLVIRRETYQDMLAYELSLQ